METEIVRTEATRHAEMSTEQLLARLEQIFRLNAEAILEAGAIIAELRCRDVEVTGLSSEIINGALHAHSGRLLPELVARHFSTTPLLTAMLSVPLSDQQQILKAGAVKLYLPNGDHKMVLLTGISKEQIEIVFGESGLRSQQQQIKKTSELATPKKKPAKSATVEISLDFFTKRELSKITKEAKTLGMTVIQFIRQAVIEKIGE